MKTDPDIKRYLTRKKWDVREDNTQYVIKKCPFCGSAEWKFYINKKTGQYICFKSSCSETGNLYRLKKSLGDLDNIERISPSDEKVDPEKQSYYEKRLEMWHGRLLLNDLAQKVLKKKWDIDLDMIQEFKLGLQKKFGRLWVVIPHFKNGKLVNAKFETLPPDKKTFRRIKDFKSVLFNIDNLDYDKKYVIMCEGETDTMRLHAAGYKNVIGVTVGAKGFKPEWIDQLSVFETKYLVYDNDIAGQDGVGLIARRLGLDTCKKVMLPETYGKDVVDFYKGGGTNKEFKKLLAGAEMLNVDDIAPLRQVVDDLEAKLTLNRNLSDSGLVTPWDKLNKICGPMVPGDLVILSVNAKIGKTTLALNILINCAQQGIPVLDYCLEMRPERTVTKVISHCRMVSTEDMNKDDIIVFRSKWGNLPLYFGYSYNLTADQVMDTIRESVKRYGIELVVFDHLHFLVRSSQNLAAEIGSVVRQFKLLAEELRIPIILIAQPRKLQNSNKKPTIHDLRDSSAIGQDADTVLIVHRDRIEGNTPEGGDVKDDMALFSPIAQVIVDASRYHAGGKVELYYDGAISKYFNNETEWERQVKKWIKS
jgi:twinkle protein